MKKALLLLFSISIFFSGNTQNLVSNPWFENYTGCPWSPNDPPTAPLVVSDWFAPTRSTPDYFNVCSNTLYSIYGYGYMGVSKNGFGYQQPASGVGYMGMIVYDIYESDYKEYISCKFSGCDTGECTMTPGVQYSVSMKVSLAETWSNAACNDLAVYFCTDTLPPFYKNWYGTLMLTPQVTFNHYGLISDTTDWVTLKDTFLADSAYRYIIIGASAPKWDMATRKIKWNNYSNKTYFYIDNVVVAPLGTEPVEPDPTPVYEDELLLFKVSPNPINDKAVFTLPAGTPASYSISLFNMMGQKIWQSADVKGREVMFDRGLLPSGIYCYQLMMRGEVIRRGKVVLE